MKRALWITATAALVLAAFPASVQADRATKYTDHRVSVFCDGEIDDGYVYVEAFHSSNGGDNAGVLVWLGDAVPFETDATFFGTSDDVAADEGDPVIVSLELSWFDADGEAGNGSLEATLERVGEPFVETDEGFGNSIGRTTRTIQFLAGGATLVLPGGDEVEVPCFGDITDEKAFFTNPHTFVFDNSGVVISCGWTVGEDGFAFLFAIQDTFGSFVDAGLFTAERDLFGSLEESDLDASGISDTIPLDDFISGDPATAEASATFEPLGDPVTSFGVVEAGKVKLVEQRLAVDGSLEFSTGESFTMDTASCFANTFDRHQVSHSRNGPKPAAPPPNDTPDGAVALWPGDRIRVNTTGTALDAEIQVVNCPESPFDNMGHTVWYTVEGTGGEITLDTAKSNFDTVMAVYVMDGDELVEIACEDDPTFEPIGSTLQAAITAPTDEGVTYWIQVGGYQEWFDPSLTDSGRLKLRVIG